MSDGEIVHLAGEQVIYDNRARQRCLWCGALIADRQLDRMAVALEPGQTDDDAVAMLANTQWNGFVGVLGNMKWAVPEDETDPSKAPAASCFRLDAAVTA